MTIPRDPESRMIECLLILNRINTTLSIAHRMVQALPSTFNRQMLVDGIRMSLDMIEVDLANAKELGSTICTPEIFSMIEDARTRITRFVDQEAPLS